MDQNVVPPALPDYQSDSSKPLKRIDTKMVNTSRFLEWLPFTRETPHTVRLKGFPVNELVPLHYASSIEIMLTCDLEGTVTVGQRNHVLRPRDVIFVPPNTVHSTNIRACAGTMTVVKFSPEELSSFMNLTQLLEFEDLSLNDIASVHDCYESLRCCVDRLIQDDQDIFLRMRDILEIFALLKKGATPGAHSISRTREGKSVHDIIRWTNEHYMEHITVDDAAKQMHFSKCYFCKYFKSVTQMTYLTYLNQVRISHAAMLLRQGSTVTEAAEQCGYTNISYFINLFREMNGCTPGKFVKRFL